MSKNMKPYVVRQGDYLVKLGFVHGFDAEETWKDPKNDEIRRRRLDHNILAPGDIVYIPVKKREGLPIVKGTTNRYEAKILKVEVVLICINVDRPLANEPCEVRGLGEPDPTNPQSTDSDGKLTLSVPVLARRISVYFPMRDWFHQFYIGDMDPVEQSSGVAKRLCNLGYLPWYSSGDTEEDDSLFRGAVASFQVKHGLDPSGEVDESTRDALFKSHRS